MTNYLMRNILVNRKWHFLFFFLVLTYSLSAQDVSVSGTVTDDSNFPLAGVSVVVKGTATGTTTNFDGLYTITVPSNATLQFSYLGFVAQEVAVNGRSSVNIAMIEDTQLLDEVVVVGYGTMERANVTGAITTVDVEEVAKVPVPNVVESLRGQVAGLQVTRTSGTPGSSPTFKIRGNNSLGASTSGSDLIDQNNTPLIVVDGVPLVNQSLSEFNTDDIESINILKDAGSASIYGTSGANGVVLITTKSGRAGRARVQVTTSTGFVDLVQTPDVMTGDQLLKTFIDISKAGDPNAPNPATILGLFDATVEYPNYIAGKEINWHDQVTRTGIQNTAGITFTGGSELGTFYLAGNMYNETGPIDGADYKRYSFRFNGELNVNDWFKMGSRVQFSKSKADQRAIELDLTLNAAIQTSPYGNLYDEDGNFTKFTTEDRFAINPLHQLKEGLFDREVDRIYINPYIEMQLADGLTYNLNSFVEQRDEFTGEFRSSQFTDGANSEGEIQDTETTTYLLDNILTYKKNWGDHGINANFVFGFQQFEWRRSIMFGENTASDELGYMGIGSAPQAMERFELQSDDWGKLYLASRLGYNYGGKYSLTLTLRRDTSSKFEGDNRVGWFPSAALAWNAHAEDWWFGGDALNQLKFRFSYGELGNDNVPSFSSTAGSQLVTLLDGTTAFRQNNVAGNKNIKWETSKQLNAGLDYGLFNNRISGSVEVYRTNTTDVLLFQNIPPALNNGFAFYPSNIGETKNEGIEASLKADVISTDDFGWTATVNWATSKNEIVSLNTTLSGTNDDIDNGWFIGQDIREIYGFKYEGVYQLNETPAVTHFGNTPQPGDGKYADVNGDGNIDFDDRTFLGNPTPDWYGGFNNVFRYKDVELSVLLEAVQGVSRINGIYGSYNQTRGNSVYINYWTPENPTNDYPRVGDGSHLTNGGQFRNSIHVEDASFVALRNVSLSYSFPKKHLENTFLNDVRFSVRGNNLYYWTDYKNAYSPEQDNIGQYPISRNWSLGVNLTF
ncbi:TonB-linked SusC/RagA family outer membrane protein [Saonia flava]|uniref:TonB-linked SusC/RagA family outer membrane protein n=1 Tax=Saonia flava TaxID=523696 RepID=A0A846R2R7_9FLAO|nr:TonB-dependent receptor [Saonia flava]NJB72245.1 TonB-linked SusC/RagA family outer membrane protein [Saonia flava]